MSGGDIERVPEGSDDPSGIDQEVVPDDAVEVLPIEVFEQRVAQVVRAEIEQTTIESLLPPAEELRAYDEVLQGGAERAMRVYEAETSFRAETDRIAITGALSENKQGQKIAKQLALLAFACSIAFGIWGGAVGSGALLILAGVFLAMPVALIVKAFLGK